MFDFICECDTPEQRQPFAVKGIDGSTADCLYCESCEALARMNWTGETAGISRLALPDQIPNPNGSDWNPDGKALTERHIAQWKGLVFGLRAFPGETFMVNHRASYYSATNGVLLYTAVRRGDGWADFAKGSPSELRRNAVNPHKES